DKPVAGEGDQRLSVGRLLPLRDRAQGDGAPLTERALEAGLRPERLVSPPPRRAGVREWARAAPRDAREADGGAKVEQGLSAARVEALARPLLHALHVCVHGQLLASEG